MAAISAGATGCGVWEVTVLGIRQTDSVARDPCSTGRYWYIGEPVPTLNRNTSITIEATKYELELILEAMRRGFLSERGTVRL